MKITNSPVLLVGVLSLFTCACATATEQAEELQFMAQIDSDDDGFISLREAVSNTDLLRRFGRIDIDEDGRISEAELISSDYMQEVVSTPSYR